MLLIYCHPYKIKKKITLDNKLSSWLGGDRTGDPFASEYVRLHATTDFVMLGMFIVHVG